MMSQPVPRYVPRRNENIGPHEDMQTNLLAALFVIAQNWKQPNVFPGLTNYGTYILWNPDQQYKGIKMIHAVTWVNLKEIMLNEKSQSQKITYYMSPVTQHP